MLFLYLSLERREGGREDEGEFLQQHGVLVSTSTIGGEERDPSFYQFSHAPVEGREGGKEEERVR